ncbi:hypothetical protein Hanom_Chr05g00440221 [Helianthus anomalus]
MWHVLRASHNSFWRETSRVVIWDAEHVNSGHHLIKMDPLYNFGNPIFLSRRSHTLHTLRFFVIFFILQRLTII